MLAGHLTCTVGELRERISYDELGGWMSYSRHSPIGAVGDDARFKDALRFLSNMKTEEKHHQPLQHFISREKKLDALKDEATRESDLEKEYAEFFRQNLPNG